MHFPPSPGWLHTSLLIAWLTSAAQSSGNAGLRARVIEHPDLVRRISLIESIRRSLSPAARNLAAVIQGSWGKGVPV